MYILLILCIKHYIKSLAFIIWLFGFLNQIIN